ncbi:MAG: class I SAM-dependent methyltransferase [Mycobacteriales bacterium]
MTAMPNAPETPGVVIGNTTKKYTAKNPAIRWLTERWVTRLDEVIARTTRDAHAPRNPLEVGCGEGVISQRLHGRFGRCVSIDLPDAGLRAEWRERPGPAYLHADALRLPFGDDAFDLIVCVEVLEHLTDPAAGLRELARVSSRHLVLSVPREPIFRGSNLLAGRYVKDLGNTPGHLNHWSAAGFQRFASHVGSIREVATPFPWTILWVTLDPVTKRG